MKRENVKRVVEIEDPKMKRITEKDLFVIKDKKKGWSVSVIVDDCTTEILYFYATRKQAIRMFLKEINKGL